MDTARSGHELGRFWAAATGCSYVEPSLARRRRGRRRSVESRGDGHRHLPGARGEDRQAPGPPRRAHRLGGRAARPRRPPARPATAGDPWTVLLDPEGGEFCAFVRDEPPAYRMLRADRRQPRTRRRSARWWAEVFGVPSRATTASPWWCARGGARDAVRVDRVRPGPGAQDGQEPDTTGTSTATWTSSPPPVPRCWSSCLAGR